MNFQLESPTMTQTQPDYTFRQATVSSSQKNPRDNFRLVEQKYISERQTMAFYYEHIQTGARFLNLENDDNNKVFGIAFKTPVSDSTGVPHILEHSVLNGSKKYPCKEPFLEMVKGSLNTFLNAFTYPDKTVYPVASQNKQDLYNLMGVYLDAVFFPLLTLQTFQQEGWHYELTKLEDPLVFKGVVYNEMKGAYSNPDREIFDRSMNSLFPDTTYQYDSGGNPEIIPNLTYEQLKAFHQRFYHPSNSYIYFYGNDTSDKKFEILNEYLSQFTKQDLDSDIDLQKPFTEPKQFRFKIAASESGDSQFRGAATVNWVVGESSDLDLKFEIMALLYALMGTPASPLYKSLIDSGLGEDVIGYYPNLNDGLDPLKQVMVSFGLKGVKIKDLDKVENLVLDSLVKIQAEGFGRAAVDSILNSLEFQLRENQTGSVPQGLSIFLNVLATWLYGADPIQSLEFAESLQKLKLKFANQDFLLQLIDKHLLNNTHRTTVILEPDEATRLAHEKREVETLAKIKSEKSVEELRQIIENTRALIQIQQTPDSPEVLQTIPTLKLTDLDRYNQTIPLEIIEWSKACVFLHDLPTREITYLNLGFNLGGLEPNYFRYLPLFTRALLETGTRSRDFVEMTNLIGGRTGGIWASLDTDTTQDGHTVAYLMLNGKVLLHKEQDLVNLLQELLSQANLDNRARLQQIVLEEKVSMESSLASSGHTYSLIRLKSMFNSTGGVVETWHGITQLEFLRSIANDFETHWEELKNGLITIQNYLLSQKPIVNLTLSKTDYTKVETILSSFVELFDGQSVGPYLTHNFTQIQTNQGWSISTQVNFVGLGLDLYQAGYDYDGSIFPILQNIRTGYLWDKIRVQGGAYGAMVKFDPMNGFLGLVSYRDPNLLQTINHYQGLPDFLTDQDLHTNELVKNIIGAIGDMDRFMLPNTKGYVSMWRHLLGITEEILQRDREAILTTNPADYKQLAAILKKAVSDGRVVVLGNKESLDGVVQAKPGWMDLRKLQ